MNEWMDKFISRCMADVPWGRYRRRAEAELRDHMQTLRQVMTEAEVLQSMGDPERLRKEYYVAWKQTPLSRANWIAFGVIAIWCLMCLSICLPACVAFIMGVDLNFMEWLPFIIFLFLIPFSLGALFLRACFREERRRAWWVTLGLLTAWMSFNPLFVNMMIGFEEYNQYYGQDLWMPMLLAKYPWLTSYLWTSFMGCLALGWIFGRKKKGSLA